jgi:hypothetical protein
MGGPVLRSGRKWPFGPPHEPPRRSGQSELAFKRIYAGSASYRDAIDYYESLGFELSAFVPNNFGYFPYLFEMDYIMIGKSFLPIAA